MDWRFDGLTALVSIAAGKAADLVVLAGNRAKNIDEVERVETVFKDGVGYDRAKLMRSAEGSVYSPISNAWSRSSSAQRARESSGIWRSTFDFAIYVEPTGKLFRQSSSVA